MKPTKKQLFVMNKMYDGFIFIMGQSEWDGSMYYQLTKGFENHYLRADTFQRLLSDEIFITDRNWEYVLSDNAWDYIHNKRNIKTLETK